MRPTKPRKPPRRPTPNVTAINTTGPKTKPQKILDVLWWSAFAGVCLIVFVIVYSTELTLLNIMGFAGLAGLGMGAIASRLIDKGLL